VFRFGRKKKEELEVGSLEYYYEKAKDNVSALSQKLAQTTAEKENLEKILIEESTMRIRERIKAAKIDAHSPQAAQSSQSETKESKETHHIVRSDETLQSIALKYFGDEKYWNDIFQANKDSVGRGGALKVGQVLVIPMAARQEVQPAAQGSSSAPQVTQVTTVKVVDQVSPFASQAVSPKEAAAPVKVIPIMVNSQNVAADNKPTETKKTADKAQKPKPKKYIVQEGDNLRSIAQKYYNDPKRWKEIYKANKDKIISGQLTPGQEITIP
jgi:nucleoid-associated protein YgaU